MLDEPRIRELVAQALDAQQTPEEVCRASPHLLADVRRRWTHARALQDQIEALFPARPSAGSEPARTETLPRIPGHELGAVLGRGGVGVVYRARHLTLERDVALKMLLAGEYASAAERTRFLREARAVASLRHAHIVQLFDVGELEGRPYFTMELVEGGSLAQALAGTPRPSGAACAPAAMLVATLADAVQAAHAGGIVHRDLKPSNVLLTREGAPKISDFGLARRLDDAGTLTASGLALGTPSYMAPEQVRGAAQAVGPAADVWALGAILYEMLTGRPPFRAESALATQLQVLSREPLAPTRLNPEVPRDLETIALTCLQKDPLRRYASAAALAEDLRRFQRGEPIAARATGRTERLLKWLRRRPAQATALAAGTLLALALLGAALGLTLQRAATARAVRADLDSLAQHLAGSEWAAARTALERAKARLGSGDTPDRTGSTGSLHARVQVGERDLALVARLDAIRLQRAAVLDGRFDLRRNRARADADYETAFRAAGLGGPGDDPTEVAARIAGSAIRAALVAALDDWALCAAHAEAASREAWLLDVAARADGDHTPWRAELGPPAERTALERLAHAALAEDAAPARSAALAERLAAAGGDARPLFLEAQRRRPDDFWTNFALGEALRAERPGEAVRYYQAALALRPDAAVAHNNLGWALALDGRSAEALASFETALARDPSFAHAHANHANALQDAGRRAEAIAAYRRALALDPGAAIVHANLAKALAEEGRLDEGLAAAEAAVALDPELPTAHVNLGFLQMKAGRVDAAIESYRRALALRDESPEVHVNLALALMAKGRVDEAIAENRRALALAPQMAEAHSGLCTALRARGRLDEAIEHGSEAVRLAPAHAEARNNLAAALALTGRLDEALAHFQEAMRLAPEVVEIRTNLGNALGLAGRLEEAAEQFEAALRRQPDSAQANGALGQALLGCGRLREAQAALQRGLALFPPGSVQHAECAQQLRTCEGLLALEPRLPGILAGHDAPADAHEALACARLLGFQGQPAPAARLYADAFDLAPALAADPRSDARYDAARCAALAGCAVDAAEPLGEEECAGLRELARTWLEAELSVFARLLERDDPSVRALVRRALPRWRTAPELAGLREPSALAALPASEAELCRAAWSELEAVRLLAEER